MLRLAVIGTKFISDLFIKGAVASGEYELYMICSRSPEKGQEYIEKYGFKKAVTTVQQAADDPDVDIVYVATPNTLHYEHVRICLDKGKHVIVEKASFVTAKQLEEMLALAESKGCFLFEAMRPVHNPNYKIVKERFEDIGKIRYAHFTLMRDFTPQISGNGGKPTPVFLPEYAGGCSYHLGIYGINAALYFFGKPEKVTYYPVMLEYGVDGTGICIMQYPELNVVVTSSIVSTGNLPDEIQGEKGTITMDYVVVPKYAQLEAGGRKDSLNLITEDNDMKYESSDFARIVNSDDKAAYADIKNIMKASMEILEECRRQAGIRCAEDTACM